MLYTCTQRPPRECGKRWTSDCRRAALRRAPPPPPQKLRNLYRTYGTSTSSSSAVSLAQISKVMYDCLGLYSVFDTSVTRVDIGIGIRSLSFLAFVKKE